MKTDIVGTPQFFV